MRITLLCLFAIGWLFAPGISRADLVELKSGGVIRGQVLQSKQTEPLLVRTVSGSDIVLPRESVRRIIRRKLLSEEFESRRQATPVTVDDLWQLSEWAREQGLKTEREIALREIVKLDAEHEGAHRGLGHIRHDGRWTTTDERMLARGYVKYKGRWVLPQEYELLASAERESEAERTWYKKVNLWKDWLVSGRVDRQAEGHRNLLSISDPNAVPSLYKAFHDDANVEARLLYVSILSQMNSEKAAGSLVTQALIDDDSGVRSESLRGIPEAARAQSVAVFVRQLKHENNSIVNRAATALGVLGDRDVIPVLIEALVTRHRYKVAVPDPGLQTGVTPDGQMVNTSGVNLPPDIARMLALGQLPYGVQVVPFNPTGAPRVQTRTATITQDQQNPSALAALRKLSDQDFGYDARSWKAWWVSSQQRGTRGSS